MSSSGTQMTRSLVITSPIRMVPSALLRSRQTRRTSRSLMMPATAPPASRTRSAPMPCSTSSTTASRIVRSGSIVWTCSPLMARISRTFMEHLSGDVRSRPARLVELDAAGQLCDLPVGDVDDDALQACRGPVGDLAQVHEPPERDPVGPPQLELLVGHHRARPQEPQQALAVLRVQVELLGVASEHLFA